MIHNWLTRQTQLPNYSLRLLLDHCVKRRIEVIDAKLHRIFWASTESQPDPFVDGFREGLRERGYIEGVNVVLELRYAPGNPD